ncbi:MAG: bifunctional DNA-formamidopyrimidine glycosylase/DNA-(apurinic or apyrimidinic site) lyase [Candidatus Anammoximicrobium sp.]|nr:bifunctional DNA-formamidopyrimidine glycosylase/DNA-(apurinic or apyrimidinic site) lyase [Candidatus Anammoximicrobium sp.]
MPELPEVETMRRGILGVVGGRVTGAQAVTCGLKPIRISPRPVTLCRRVVGRRIVAVERLGKRVLIRLDCDAVLVFEPRMTGLVLLADPPDAEHLRFRLQLAGVAPRQVLFWDRRGLGSVRLLSPRQLQTELGPNKLGPDALEITADDLRGRLRTSRRAVKVALLDQRAVAGIGNLYASEMLHMAGIHPAKRCDRLTGSEWQRLHAALRHVLSEAIRYEGSTLADGTYRNALNAPGSYQNQHRVYDRAAASCPTCGAGPIRRMVQAQRATFFCPDCQRLRGGKNRRRKAGPPSQP